MKSSDRATKDHDRAAYVCVDYEVDGVPNGPEPKSLIESIFLDNGASLIEHQLPIVASFEDPAAAVEASLLDNGVSNVKLMTLIESYELGCMWGVCPKRWWCLIVQMAIKSSLAEPLT